MNKKSWALVAILFTGPAVAAVPATQPLPYFNQSPLVGIYGLPDASGYTALEGGAQAVDFKLDFTSHFTSESNPDEAITLDGETTRLALVYRRGLGDGITVFGELPFIDHSAGFADSAIDEFHDITGFRDGGRSQGPRDRQLFRYRRDGTARLRVADSPAGLGDVRLELSKQVWSAGNQGASIAAQIKLPTGDADKLTGSGATDIAAWGSWGRNGLGDWPVSLVGGLGAIYTGGGDVLASQRQRTAAFGWLTLAYAWSPTFAIKTQLYSHTPFFDNSRFKALTGTAAQGALGFGWLFAEDTSVDFSIIEDLNFSASPDVSFNLVVRRAF